MSQTPPETAQTWQIEGAERYRAGDLPGAIAAISEAARLAPSDPAYLLNLAELARASGQRETARSHVERAAALAGADAGRLNLLAAAWLDLGDPGRALDATVAALAAGGGVNSRKLFVEAVKVAPRPDIRNRLAQALREGWSRADGLAAPALQLLREAWPNSAAALLGDELLAACLTSIVICDVALEQRLTALRRSILLRGAAPEALLLVAQLASQCHLNEYAWTVDADERDAAAGLAARLPTLTPVELAALASYQSLGGLPDADALLGRDWPEPIRDLLREQVSAPSSERALAAALPALTEIREGVSAQVRELYEENPYPRWTRLPQLAPMPLGQILRSALPGARLEPPPPTGPDVLIAGCGTGQHAIQASQYAGARLLAVDLSRASLGYAARKAREAGLQNIEFAQADLLELGGVGRTFDVIEAMGVLHHLADPSEGARILSGLLRPGGLLKLGLYSATARAALRPAKDVAKLHRSDSDGIRAMRAAIMNAPPGDPARAVLGIPDFYAASNCRDLLMHVQEHELTLDGIRAMLAELGLRFLGFSGPARAVADYHARFPGADAADLANWAVLEAERPLTFIGMYQFWVQKPV